MTKVARRASSRQRNIKFVKLRYQEAEMEPAGVPALLAYRNGEKFAGLVPLVDEIPDDADLSETTLEVMLQKWVSSFSVTPVGLTADPFCPRHQIL